ncbi:MAG: DUF4444 domain-containing protein [Alphaproteobacteria bacterium]|nr:DUF4444 domain-containing protein [Alphaproteobacteria bacterium]
MEPSFPPLMSGHPVEGAADPFDKARALAALGCDAGTVAYNIGQNSLKAAIVFGPEVPLANAMAMLPLCGVGFQNALGALGPPEVAVHLAWDGRILVNGAFCGRLRVAASTVDPAEVPDWLVVGLELPLWPDSDRPGETPDQTAIYAEGCAEVDPTGLLESWARHTLVGINRWADEGGKPLHNEWRPLAWQMGEDVVQAGHKGTFLGVDENFGMLLRDAEETRLIPLTALLEAGS